LSLRSNWIGVASLNDYWNAVEAGLLSNERVLIAHHGNRGEEAEGLLRAFLAKHLPKRYGVSKGAVVFNSSGAQSYAADVIVYDANHTPLIRNGDVSLVPDGAVYGVIEVTETLDSEKLAKDNKKIAEFKTACAAPLPDIDFDASGHPYFRAAPRPFGMIVGFAGVELRTLEGRYQDLVDQAASAARRESALADAERVLYGGECADLVALLGDGVLSLEEEIEMMGRAALRNSDAVARAQLGRGAKVRLSRHPAGALGEFFTRLNATLSTMRLNPVRLEEFVSPEIGIFALSQEDED
jgi:hypothetical protein